MQEHFNYHAWNFQESESMNHCMYVIPQKHEHAILNKQGGGERHAKSETCNQFSHAEIRLLLHAKKTMQLGFGVLKKSNIK